MSQLESKVFTAELTSETLVIESSFGVRLLSIYNPTSTVGTVVGNQSLGGKASSPINLAEGETFTTASVEGSVITGVTIDAPAGCTLKVTAII
jgi:hypothetical protein